MDPRTEGSYRGLLTVAVTSRALFDLEDEDRLFREQGEAAYVAWQREHRDEVPCFGTAYPLVRKLLAFRDPEGKPLVEVILASRNDISAGLRIAKAIDVAGLPVVRRTFTRGRSVAPYLRAYGVDLFLSAHEADVRSAMDAGVAAAMALPSRIPVEDQDDLELRVAFDGDSTILGSEGDRFFREHGLLAYQVRERDLAEEPLSRGPVAPFLEGLVRLRAMGCPVRIGLFTARCAPADVRPLRTLESWGLVVDEAHCLGARGKAPFLEAFGADIFFDDSLDNVRAGAKVAPTSHVLLRREE